jgi:hypothetical protein
VDEEAYYCKRLERYMDILESPVELH